MYSRQPSQDHFEDYGLMERCAQRRADGNALVSNADYEAAKAMYDKALQVHLCLIGLAMLCMSKIQTMQFELPTQLGKFSSVSAH